jgi:hypothetical protein
MLHTDTNMYPNMFPVVGLFEENRGGGRGKRMIESE